LLLFHFSDNERNGMFCRLSVVVEKKNHHQKPMEGKTMRIGVPKERLANETRVAATPKTVEQLLNSVYRRG
jgi:NAD(P) transhydrogenase subunit alpha